MAKAALAFAAGFGTGYLKQKQQNQIDADRQEDRAMRQKEFDAQEEERNRLKDNRTRMSEASALRETNTGSAVVEGLSTKPVVYESADVASGDLRQDRRLREASANQATPAPAADGPGLGLQIPPTPQPERQDSTTVASDAVAPNASPAPTMRKAITSGGQEYSTQEEADAATKKYNDGRSERISQELYRQGEPGKAMQMDAATMELQEKKRSHAQKMIDEGAVQVAKAARAGDPDAVRAAANASGDYKIEGEIKVTPETRTLKGMGEVPTFNYSFTAVGKDGKPRQMQFNSHDLSMQTLEYSQILDVGFKGQAADDKTAYNAQVAEARMKAAEAAETRVGLYGASRGTGAGSRGSGAGSPSKEIDEAWDRANTGAAKLEPEQLMTGRRLTEELVVNSEGKMPASLASEIAFKVTADPTLVQPSVNKDTGQINGVYAHPTMGQVVIGRDLFSANDPKGQKPEVMKGVTDQYLATLPDADRASMIEAARDQTKTASLMQALYVQANQQIAARAKLYPQISAKDNHDWGERYKAGIRQSLQRKLDLVGKFGPQPKAAKKETSVANPLSATAQPGPGLGMGYTPPAGSPAAKAQAAREQTTTQATAKAAKADEAQKSLSAQFQADSKALSPLDLARKYDPLRAQLPAPDAAALQAIERQL